MTAAKIQEISRVRRANGVWFVEILSALNGRWIIQGKWKTKPEAEDVRQNWINLRQAFGVHERPYALVAELNKDKE